MNQTRENAVRCELFLCMGSACHQLGVYQVLPQLQRLVREHGLDATVELKGAFCLECCAEGIALKIHDRMFTRLTPRNIAGRFRDEILPVLKQHTERPL